MEPIKTVLADPPWQFGDKLPGPSRGAERNYSTLSVQELHPFLAQRLSAMGLSLAPSATLYLWRVASMQEEALAVMRAWGFVPKAEVVWLKRTSTGKRWFGMGRTVRMEHEVCLIGKRGSPLVKSRSVRSTFEAAYTRHSGKPDAFYGIVESLSEGPYLELFARERRAGWLQDGDELVAAPPISMNDRWQAIERAASPCEHDWDTDGEVDACLKCGCEEPSRYGRVAP